MVDNTELIRNFIADKFTSDDVFFFVQVMVRRKDNPDLDGYNRVIQSYYIHSLQDFDNKIGEIKKVCDMFKARAYFNPNCKSFKNCAMYMMKELAEIIIKEDYYHAKSLYTSVCGQHSIGDKLWIVDIDTKDASFVSDVCCFIESVMPNDMKKVVLTVSTKNGVHLITRPFNMVEFRKKFIGIDVHKDNPTLLYFNED